MIVETSIKEAPPEYIKSVISAVIDTARMHGTKVIYSDDNGIIQKLEPEEFKKKLGL